MSWDHSRRNLIGASHSPHQPIESAAQTCHSRVDTLVRDALASPHAHLRAASGQNSPVCDAFELLAVHTHSRPTRAAVGILTATTYLQATSGDIAHSVYTYGNPSPAAPAPAIEARLAAPHASPASVPRGASARTIAA